MELKNKKGVFFIAIAIVMITLLLTSYTLYSNIQERKAIQKRIETMNSFINSINQDLERKLFIAGFRSLFTFENKIIETGAYISDVNASFQEMFINGTFNNQTQSIMLGATVTDIIKDMQGLGSKIAINITLTGPKANIDQTDPWHVRITLGGNFTIRDENNLSSWNTMLSATGTIPIYYFDDPIYIINTGSLVVTKINQTIYSSFDSASLLDHTTKQYYKASQNAPSFLDRLEGSLNANSPNGIESLVDIQSLQNKGLQTQEKSIVDYIYFSSSNPTYCHTAGMPSWFYLNNNSLSAYNATCG
ncbi:MAG: hypothetical protein AABY16_02605 [Nanoarchaeota archaeon]